MLKIYWRTGRILKGLSKPDHHNLYHFFKLANPLMYEQEDDTVHETKRFKHVVLNRNSQVYKIKNREIQCNQCIKHKFAFVFL